MAEAIQTRPKRYINTWLVVRIAVGVLVGAYLLYHLWIILFVEQPYGPDTWLRFIISGTILGSV